MPSESVRGFVQQQHGWVTEQRGGDSEPLAHPQRERADALVRDVGQPDELDQLVDTGHADAVSGRQDAQVVARCPSRMHRTRLEQGADLVERRAQVAVPPPTDERVPGGGVVEAEDQAHRRRLAGTVRSEEAGHDTR
jgi:hypothetical protein